MIINRRPILTLPSLCGLQAPRAKIFRRDEGDAASLGGMRDLMRSNNWLRDPVRCPAVDDCPDTLLSSQPALCSQALISPLSTAVITIEIKDRSGADITSALAG